MRRGLKIGQTRPSVVNNGMRRDLDWLVDQWQDASPEARLQLVLSKIRHEEKVPQEPNRPGEQ